MLSKRLTALALSAVLVLTPALALAPQGKLPAVKEYPGFSDVVPGAWYESAVKTCYEVDLMTGTGVGFEPGKTLTAGEAASIAARLREAITGEAIPENQPGAKWYQRFLDYLTAIDPSVAPLLSTPTETISRLGFFRILALAVDDDLLLPINNVTSLPDTDDPTVLAFYNAGILAGTDKYGTFTPDRTLTRMECAGMVSRIADPDLRVSVSLTDYAPFAAARVTPGTPFFPGVTAEAYLTEVNSVIAHLEKICSMNDMEFNWLHTYGDQTFLVYVKETALSELGVTADSGTDAYKAFDVQVYYSRLIDLTGGLG